MIAGAEHGHCPLSGYHELHRNARVAVAVVFRDSEEGCYSLYSDGMSLCKTIKQASCIETNSKNLGPPLGHSEILPDGNEASFALRSGASVLYKSLFKTSSSSDLTINNGAGLLLRTITRRFSRVPPSTDYH